MAPLFISRLIVDTLKSLKRKEKKYGRDQKAKRGHQRGEEEGL